MAKPSSRNAAWYPNPTVGGERLSGAMLESSHRSQVRAVQPVIGIETRLSRQKPSGGGGEYPIKRQDSQEFRFRCLPLPPTTRIGAGDSLISKHFHGLDIGKRCGRAFALEVDVVSAFRAFEDESVCVAHVFNDTSLVIALPIGCAAIAPDANSIVHE